MAAVDPPFEDNDLSGLPSTNPGSGKPWRDPTTGALIVGAIGTFGMTQAAADARYAALSHTHTIANVTGLQAALDGKQAAGSYAAAVHSHAISDVTGLSTALAGKADLTGATFSGSVTMMAETRFGSNADRILQSSQLGYMIVETNTPMRLRATSFSIREFFSDAIIASMDTSGVVFGGTGAITLPSGTTAQRPASPVAGMQRWNTSSTRHEFHNGSAWVNHVRLNGDTMSGSLAAVTFFPLAFAGSANGCSISATGGSSGTMVLSGGGAQQAAIESAAITVGATWVINWTNGNYNQTKDLALIRNAAGQLDVRGDSGLRVKNFANSADAALAAGAATFSGVVRSGVGNVPAATPWGPNALAILGAESVSNQEFVLCNANSTATTRPVMLGRRARGTLAAPTIVAASDQLFTFLASGYDGAVFQNPALIDFIVDGSPALGSVPTRISIVTGSSAGDRAERLQVRASGAVNISTTLSLGAYTVATLPSASANARAKAYVTDSSLAFTSANLGSTVTAGGSNLVPVWSNGTNWVIG